MASRDYCANVAEELEGWSVRLHDLSDEIGRIPSLDKYRLLPQIEQLHIIMTELDDRLCELVDSCPLLEGGETGKARVGSVPLRREAGRNSGEKFDYEVGG